MTMLPHRRHARHPGAHSRDPVADDDG